MRLGWAAGSPYRTQIAANRRLAYVRTSVLRCVVVIINRAYYIHRSLPQAPIHATLCYIYIHTSPVYLCDVYLRIYACTGHTSCAVRNIVSGMARSRTHKDAPAYNIIHINNVTLCYTLYYNKNTTFDFRGTFPMHRLTLYIRCVFSRSML